MANFALSSKVAATILPPIPRARAWSSKYDGSAGPLLNLSQGVPGDPPPPQVLQAIASASMDPSSAGYGPILGEPELREALAIEMADIYRWPGGLLPGQGVTAENIMITGGANAAYSEEIGR
jgi:aspartate/methionine/tyrosine aminotransferase